MVDEQDFFEHEEDEQGCDDSEVDELRDHEGVESHVVVLTDTVVDPGTVVVEPFDTAVTHRAVTAPGGSDCLTVWTQLSALDCLQETHEVCLAWTQVARVSEGSQCEEHDCQNGEDDD